MGQQVLVSQKRHYRSQLGPSGPFAPRAAGPFVIIKMITRNTFVLDIPASTLGRASPVFHASDLIPYESRLLVPEAGVDPTDFDSQAQADVNAAQPHANDPPDDSIVLVDPFAADAPDFDLPLPAPNNHTNDILPVDPVPEDPVDVLPDEDTDPVSYP